MTAKNASKNVSDFYGASTRAKYTELRLWADNNIIPVIECASYEGFCWSVFNIPEGISRTYLKSYLKDLGYRVRNFRNGIIVDW